MKQCALACLIVMFTGPILPQAHAQEAEGTLDKISRTGEILIGYRGDASPLSYENSDGQPSGYSVDLCRRIAAAVKAELDMDNLTTTFVQIKSDERLSAVIDGSIDIECGSTTITLSRQELVDFTIPTFVTGGGILSSADGGIQGLSDLSGKRVGVVEGTTTVEELENYLKTNLIDAEMVVVKDRSEGMNRLNRDDIQAFASDQIVLIGQIIGAKNPKRYSLSEETFSYEPYGFTVRRNDADFRLVANRALVQLYRSGQHAQIYDKWIGRIGVRASNMLLAMYQLNTIPE